jgi:hypothetical protein
VRGSLNRVSWVRACMEADFDVQALVCAKGGPFAANGRHYGRGK